MLVQPTSILGCTHVIAQLYVASPALLCFQQTCKYSDSTVILCTVQERRVTQLVTETALSINKLTELG